jgi:hypothetical protein
MIAQQVCLTSFVILLLTMLSIHMDSFYLPSWKQQVYGGFLCFSFGIMLISFFIAVWS